MKVNLGCGRIVRSGFVNVDRYPHEGVDVVHDLDQVPWPFADESVDYIWASHVLEHVASLERTIREVHRILRVGGVLEVRVTVRHQVPLQSVPPTRVRPDLV